MTFRPDINGLRAIAVLVVMLFHFGVPGFQGGFIGVDVFFTISGFLMTGIIFNKLDRQKFSLVDFYLARARRIIPALAVLCLGLMVFGWVIFIPTEYLALGKHISSSITFFSNIVYWSESGYFDVASHEKWLLHTWSLSVEWQFYIIYPAGILLISQIFKPSTVKRIVVFMALISFCLSIYASDRWPGAAFYMLPTRAWEMLAGGLIYLYPFTPKTKIRLPMQWLGLGLIAASTLFFRSTDMWPGWLAAIPVAGSLAIMLSACQTSALINHPAAQLLGNISYSVYLWHWPLVVALHYFGVFNDPLWTATGITASLVAGYLSFRFVEQPMRNLGKHAPDYRSPFLQYCAIVALIALPGLALILSKGMPFRVNEVVVLAEQEIENSNPREKECDIFPDSNLVSPGCIFGQNQEKVGVIVIGDSHANALINAVGESVPVDEGGALYLGAHGCMSMLNMQTKYFHDCGKFNQDIHEKLMNEHANVPVVIINRTTAVIFGRNEAEEQEIYYLDAIKNTDPGFLNAFRDRYINAVCEIAGKHPVYIMKPIPEMPVNVPKTLIKKYMSNQGDGDIYITMEDYQKRHAQTLSIMEQAKNTCGVHLLDPVPELCFNGKCMGSMQGRPLYYDDDHLSEHGNRFLVPMFRQIWPTAPLTTQNLDSSNI